MAKTSPAAIKALQARLTAIKKEFAKGEGNAVQAQIMLISLENNPSVWKWSKTHTFRGLLIQEGLVTPTRHIHFKRAVNLNLPVKKYGVGASCRLARLTHDQRRKVVTKLEAWCKTHESVPTYQRVSKYISSQLKGSRPKTRLQKLKERVTMLEGILRKNGVTVPA